MKVLQLSLRLINCMRDALLDNRKGRLSAARFTLSEEGEQVKDELGLESQGCQVAIVPLKQRQHCNLADVQTYLLRIDAF